MPFCYNLAFLITTEITENTEISGRDVPPYNNAFLKKSVVVRRNVSAANLCVLCDLCGY